MPPVTDEKQQAPSGSPCWQQAGSGFQIQEPAIQMGQFSLSAQQPLAERFGGSITIFACTWVALTVKPDAVIVPILYRLCHLNFKKQRRDFPGGPAAYTLHSQCGGSGLILGQRTRFHVLQLRFPVPSLKLQRAAAKTWCCQINK